ncbi:dipeptide ABC transporter ATP-binding protein [Litorihabitans aurantiacus]|uniref:ABC transporter ATP-binding protein n=1 Tax=Litorihabitans aurantiacus TaxID=1930061 RepID=A0AA37XDS6_9MICO|nr:ABC transporter ATP-binding protein [Litorihabitans aurantiacus]
MSAPLLRVSGLTVEFTTAQGPIPGVQDVSFEIAPGQTLALVGESGSGKSTTAACVNRLLAANGTITAGSIELEGRDLLALDEREMTRVRGAGIGLVPQDPMSNLDPLQRIGTQIAEALRVHGEKRRTVLRDRAVELLAMVGIPEPERRARQYPHELSGGMQQRVLIAIGLASRPRLLIADEPTSALDVTVQRTILDRLGELTTELGTSVLLITHDLELAAERSEQVVVMQRGRVVEQGASTRLLRAPREPYTRALVAASPTMRSTPLVEGSVPDTASTLLEVQHLRKTYRRGRGREDFVAVEDSSFALHQGETVAIVGESGSGKSTTARMMLGLERPDSGRILVRGRDLTTMRRHELMDVRTRVQPVFQNPYGSLDPHLSVMACITEPLDIHRVGSPRSRRALATELLEMVALPAELATRRPAALSGGQRQRVAIARALALQPELVVLDEAVSALDVVVQKQILELLVRLQRELGLSYLFISHDLAAVRLVAHQVLVMQRGRIVERGTPAEIFDAPGIPTRVSCWLRCPPPRRPRRTRRTRPSTSERGRSGPRRDAPEPSAPAPLARAVRRGAGSAP